MKYRFDLKEFIDKDDLPDGISFKTLQTILSFITGKYCYNRDDSQWVEIMAKDFNKEYKPYLEYLKNKGIIIIDYKYEVGKRSRRYCFNDRFKSLCKIDNIISDTNDTRYEDNNKCIPEKLKRKLEKDFKKLKVSSFDIDKEIIFNIDGLDIYNFKNYLYNFSNLKKIDEHNFYFKWKSDCRLYNSFTCLSSKVKLNNCSLGKDRLNVLDIRSSFPLFLSIWCADNRIDINDFKDGLLHGDFYEELSIKLNKVKDRNNETGPEKPRYDREKSKISFARWLNGDNINKDGSIRNDDINYVFQNYFPSIFKMMLDYKEDRNTFYYLLSQLESDFIFNIICSRLYKEVPGIKLLTCHDSIYFEDRYSDKVNIIWKEELEKLYAKLN